MVSGGHPGPATVVLPDEIRAAIVAHARGDYPNEACGIISGTAAPAAGGTASRWFATRNQDASPLRFTIHPDDLYRIYTTIDDADEEVWAIVHSHVRSAARPSATDIGLATSWPDALYVLVSLAEEHADPLTGEPGIRAWRIVDGEVFEVELTR